MDISGWSMMRISWVAGKKSDNSWDYRVRIRANAQVNDRTKVTYGITTGY